MMKLQIPEQFTTEWREARAKYAQEHCDATTASITESYSDITTCQRMDYLITDSTVKNRNTAIRRWAKVLDSAGITNQIELDDNERRAILLRKVDEAIDNGDLGSTPGAIARSMEHFGAMLNIVGYDKAEMIHKAVKNVLKSKKLIDCGVAPYKVDELVNLFQLLTQWLDDNTLAPSLNDRPSTGKRTRAPSYPSIYLLSASIAIACNTGGRIGSLLEIKVDDIDLNTGEIKWAEIKGQMIRHYSYGQLDNWQIELIKPWVQWRTNKYPDTEHFFVAPRTGRPHSDQTAYTNPLKRALEAAEIIGAGERGGFHRFRHTIACEAIREGASRNDVATALNNSESMISKVYGKYMNGHIGTKVRSILSDKIANALGVAQERTNPLLQPSLDELNTIKNQIWKQAEADCGMELTEPSVHFGIPKHIQYRTLATIAEAEHKSAACRVRTGDLGIKTHNTGDIIAQAASQAITELENGNAEMATAILANLASWGDSQ